MQENHDGHRKRLKYKIEKFGFDSLYPHEMLEFILFASIPRRNTNNIAHALINKFGSYEEVFSKSKEELMTVDGIGPSSVIQIHSYAHHANKIMGIDQPQYIRNLGEARDYFEDYFSKKRHEEFHMVFLDAEGIATTHDIYTDKSNSRVVVPIASIMQMVASCRPSFIIFAHNHPSGDASPSQRDIEFTKSLWKNLEQYLGLTNCEHLIFAKGSCYSFRHNGLLGV